METVIVSRAFVNPPKALESYRFSKYKRTKNLSSDGHMLRSNRIVGDARSPQTGLVWSVALAAVCEGFQLSVCSALESSCRTKTLNQSYRYNTHRRRSTPAAAQS